MKKVLSVIVLCLLIAYISVSLYAFCDKPSGIVCERIGLELKDSVLTGLVTKDNVMDALKAHHINPIGQPMDDISCRDIEHVLDSYPLIAKSECYKTVGGSLHIEIVCRTPILRVISDSGSSYYIDEEGEVLRQMTRIPYVPLATGHISVAFARNELYQLALYLRDHKVWKAQIEQIYVDSRGQLSLVPRVGSHLIVLGRPGNYAYKFDKLHTFYAEGLNRVGWDRYSTINIDYTDQVVGTKK